MATIFPKRIDDVLTNPGIGFFGSQKLMSNPDVVLTRKNEPVDKYIFNENGKTLNHPDSTVMYKMLRWMDLEPEQGKFDWSTADNFIETAKGFGCTAVLSLSPYSIPEQYDVPEWMRKLRPDDQPDFVFWRVTPDEEYADWFCKLVKAFGERYDGHPQVENIDLTIIGAWGEGGGTEFLDEPILHRIIDSYFDAFKQTPMCIMLHDPRSADYALSHNRPLGYRLDCLGDMGGFHADDWTHMFDFYPQILGNTGFGEVWKNAPVCFEVCWVMSDWYRHNWDMDYIIDESLKWHISRYNEKGDPVPEAWKDKVERWLKKMGYRFEVRSCDFSDFADDELCVKTHFVNVGVACPYYNYPYTVRLEGENGTFEFSPIVHDTRKWMPGEDVVCDDCIDVSAVPSGDYEIQIGLKYWNDFIGNVKLAIEGRNAEGFYPMGKVKIK